MRLKRRVFRAVIAVGLAAVWVLSGTAAFGAAAYGNGGSAPARQISQIEVVDQPEAVHVLIQGRPLLTYTSVKQSAPRGLILYFSNTGLETSRNFFVPPNPVLQSVTATEVAREGTTARVQLLLKRDALYEINRQGGGLKVVIDKAGLSAPPAPAATRSAPPPPAPAMVPAATVAPVGQGANASRLQSVYAARFGDALKVFVGADGMITNYRSFTIESPARIVFDLFNIRSPYPQEKVVPVNTRWVSQIRYHNYPDRVRVILDTQPAYLNQFSAHPVENGLLIHMGQGVRQAEARSARPTGPSSAPEGSRIQSVYASQTDGGIRVTVRGDGPIRTYRTRIAQNPARIIVELPGVQSPYAGEQSFPVDTQWVRSVTHERLSDRVQVTIHTRPEYLQAFSARPSREGMEVFVGGPGSPSPGSEAPRTAAANPSAGPRTVSGGPRGSAASPASVTGIDFTGEEAGKSTLAIETNRPVRYEVRETGNRGLEVRLFNTRLPREKRRPLITNRFESAVDRIEPEVAGANPNAALFSVQLREGVPFFVEQMGDRLLVHFEASSIPPKPVTSIQVADGGDSYSAPPPTPTETTPRSGDFPEAGNDSGMPPAPLDMPPAGDMGDAMEFDLSEEAMAAEQGPQYTGEKIALDFFETDIRNVFRILREVSGMNFAIEPDVTGQVTLTLAQPVPWDQVLDLILKMNKLGKEAEGNIIRIATRETLEEEERLRQEKRTAELTLRDQQKQLEPLVTEYLPVNYSNAAREIQPHIETILTQERGTVSVDERTNVVIMTDTADKIAQAKELIRKLDRVTPQVIIEARVVEATTDFSRDIGTQWGTGLGVQSTELLDFGRPDIEDAEEAGGLTGEVQDSLNNRVGFGPERGYNNLGGTYGYNMAMNFPVAAENFGSIGFNFVRIAGTPFLLNATLQALESKGEAKIISAPKVVTLDNKQAVIKQGVSYPIQTVEDGEVNVEFVDVDLLLEVTPHVTPDNRISMSINITKNDLGQIIQNQQSFTTKEAQTELLVNDGDTVVIGGIIKTTDRTDFSGIPGLAKIPILGWFFKNEGRTDSKEELLIFITPRIVQLEQRTAQF